MLVVNCYNSSVASAFIVAVVGSHQQCGAMMLCLASTADQSIILRVNSFLISERVFLMLVKKERKINWLNN